MRELTGRQREVLRAIHDHVERHGGWPTLRELGAALGIASDNAVHGHLTLLRRKGFVREQPGAGGVVCGVRLAGCRARLMLDGTPDGRRLADLLGSRVPAELPQPRMVRAVARHVAEHETWPTVRELVAALEYDGPNGVRSVLTRLRARGWLTWEERSARSIRLAGARLVLELEGEAGDRLREALGVEAESWPHVPDSAGVA